MNKPIITQAQADAIEAFRKTFIENKATSMSNKTLIRALNQGYEVEPEFKEMDWIYNEKAERVAQITGISRSGCLYVDDEQFNFYHIKDSRHATPGEIAEEKERRFFARHGRDPWELREDDILKYLGDLLIVDSFDSEEVCLKGNAVVYTKSINFVTDNFKFVAFAEDRLDVK